MELKFDKNRKRVKHCPCCGHENKSDGYVPFIGTDNGYCNYCNSTCMKDKNDTIVPLNEIPRYTPKPVDYMSEYYIEKSFTNHENIDFVKFLLKIFDPLAVEEIIEKYNLCGSVKRPGDVIFWQIDKYDKIRTGKIMQYDPETGKRCGYINWVHDESYGLKQCFFGENLITKGKTIAVVESEKTACIMSYIIPNRTWIVSGGSNGLTRQKCEILKDHDIILFPDHGKFREWSDRASEIGLKCQTSIDCEEFFELGLIEKGEDIADYYLRNHQLKEKKIDPEWN